MDASSKRLQKLPTIPEDIIIVILLRLGVKSLLLFKLVCKTWYNVIKSPSFISMHHNFRAESQLLICTNDLHKIEVANHVFSARSNDKHARVLSPDFEIPATPNCNVRVAGSCNGIVCYFDYAGQIFLCNPATREFKKLPPTCIKTDVCLWQLGVCFGSDSSNIYDFKVLRVLSVRLMADIRELNPETSRAEMFTLSSNSWSPIEWGLDKSLLFLDRTGLFWANSFHFLAKPPSSSELTIVCLEFDAPKVTKLIDFPSKAEHLVISNSLMVVKEFLSVAFQLRADDYGSVYVEIWIMKDYGVVESWTKLCRIRTGLGIARALCFVRMDEHELLVMEDNRDNLVTFDLNRLRLGGIKIDGYKQQSEVVVHKESLVSIM